MAKQSSAKKSLTRKGNPATSPKDLASTDAANPPPAIGSGVPPGQIPGGDASDKVFKILVVVLGILIVIVLGR